jgi:hypothetical protein
MIWLATTAGLMLVATIALLVVIQGKLYEMRKHIEEGQRIERELRRERNW